jgi:hypothetical protein
LAVNQEAMLKRELTNDYIRGLIDGEGSFTFSTNKKSDGTSIKIPVFQLKMHIRDKDLVEGIRDYLGLGNKIYIYHHPGKDGYNRGPTATLMVRDFGSLKNIIIPFFYERLAGHKAIQFDEWLEKIQHDPMVPESYSLLYRLHRSGFYRENSKFK